MDTGSEIRELEVIMTVALDLESQGHQVKIMYDGLMIQVDGGLYLTVT